MTRILLVDDHPMIASALEMLLRETPHEFVGRARTAAEGRQMIAKLKPELLLLDVQLPDASGIDVLGQLGNAGPGVILLTAGMDDAQLLAADALSPAGMVLKTSDPILLLEAIDAVAAGQRWVDPEIAERTAKAKDRAASAPALTRRERELVELVRQGLRNRDIAAELGVTEGTVKVYLHAIFDKCKVDNRTELAMRAAEFLGR